MKRDVAARIITKQDTDALYYPLSGLTHDAEILIVTSARRAVEIGQLAPGARIVTNIETLECIEPGFDAAFIDRTLESDPWDRWTLQCVHRALRTGGRLVVVVSPITSLASAIDVGFLAYASKEIISRFGSHLGSRIKFHGPVHRRYHLPRLVRKLTLLGFSDVEAAAGWPRSGAPGWFARRSILTARKTSSLVGLNGRQWPDPIQHRERYCEQWPALLAAREDWLRRFPQYRDAKAQALDPAQWSQARVLVLSPHPDDELVGCGGTLLRLIAGGTQVCIIQATDGSKLESLRGCPEPLRKRLRLEEAARVAAALGARLVLWRQEDAQLRCSSETVSALAQTLSQYKPTHVFTPLTTDWHADHRMVSEILGKALAISDSRPEVLQYEVWSAAPANVYCDVTEQAHALEDLLLLYRRAMRVADYVHMWEARTLTRALELTGRPGYTEAFLSTSADDFRAMVDTGYRG